MDKLFLVKISCLFTQNSVWQSGYSKKVQWPAKQNLIHFTDFTGLLAPNPSEYIYNIPYSFLLWNNWKFGWLIWMSCWFLNEFLGPPLLFKAGQGWQIGERTKKKWAKKLIGSQSQLLVKWGSSLIVKDWIFFYWWFQDYIQMTTIMFRSNMQVFYFTP